MRYAYLTSLAVLVAAGVWWTFTGPDSPDPAPLNASDRGVLTADGVLVRQTNNPAATKGENSSIKNVSTAPRSDARIDPQLQSRLDTMHQRRQGKTYRPDEVAAVLARDTAWVPLDKAPTSLPLKPEEFTDGRQFIQFNPLKLESLLPGDTLTVTLEREQYRVEIDAVEPHGTGRTSWHGHLAGLGQHYSVTFTRGESLTVGGLDTPKGHYVLQAHGQDGWIATSELLFKINPNVTDVIIPPSDELGH